MIGRSLLAAAVLVAFSTPALGFQCPLDVKAIDAAFGNIKLTDEQSAKAVALRNEGEALHNAGKHKESVDKLTEAMRIMLEATSM